MASTMFPVVFILLVLGFRTPFSHSAPTQHLRIGVEGDMPALIVTSDEIDVTTKQRIRTPAAFTSAPKLKPMNSKESIMTATTTTPLVAKYKPKQAKSDFAKTTKNKSLKAQFEKKSQQASKAKEYKDFKYQRLQPATTTISSKLPTSTLMPLRATSVKFDMTTSTLPLDQQKGTTLMRQPDHETRNEPFQVTKSALLKTSTTTAAETTKTPTRTVENLAKNENIAKGIKTSTENGHKDGAQTESIIPAFHGMNPSTQSVVSSTTTTNTPTRPIATPNSMVNSMETTTESSNPHKVGASATPTTGIKINEDIEHTNNNNKNKNSNDNDNSKYFNDNVDGIIPTAKTLLKDNKIKNKADASGLKNKTRKIEKSSGSSNVAATFSPTTTAPPTNKSRFTMTVSPSSTTSQTTLASEPIPVIKTEATGTKDKDSKMAQAIILTSAHNNSHSSNDNKMTKELRQLKPKKISVYGNVDNVNNKYNAPTNHESLITLTTEKHPSMDVKTEAVMKANKGEDATTTTTTTQEAIMKVMEMKATTITTPTLKSNVATEIHLKEATSTPKAKISFQGVTATTTKSTSTNRERTGNHKNDEALTRSLQGNNDEIRVADASDAVVKLIDLEKHEVNGQSAVPTSKVASNTQTPDDGHDGVKQTKKKQLFDKHFTEVVKTVDDLPFEADIYPDIALHTTPSANLDTKPSSHSAIASPTLMPVHKGFLGPIHMEEHTFSAAHRPNQAYHEHGPSIESQLRDGRIVEIVAQTQAIESSTKATTSQPVTSDEIKAEEQGQHQTPVLSTTVFQIIDQTSSSEKPSPERTESKISDIQIEVYDSTADSIVAETNFKDSFPEVVPDSYLTATRSPASMSTAEERFTQYVIDRIDDSTQETNLPNAAPLYNLGTDLGGKPEPAAIEIHINVTEGSGNSSDDLEFSFRPKIKEQNSDLIKSLNLKSDLNNGNQQAAGNKYSSDDILVVEIIDTGDSNSSESQYLDKKPVLILSPNTNKDAASVSKAVSKLRGHDELFMADVKSNSDEARKSTHGIGNAERDSDTIFYISNTEVKVGESPVESTFGEGKDNYRKAQLESQFFPASYVANSHVDNPESEKKGQHTVKHLYEEDIILSPVRDTADSLKIFRSQNVDSNPPPPLDVTYVGESIMEIEQPPESKTSHKSVVASTTAAALTATSTAPQQIPDVIIEPAVLPEMSIGVPVIGELPPQIELKEIDFMPNEANQLRSGMYNNENDIEETNPGINNALKSNNNNDEDDVDRLVESSIQYGGDLIDEDAGGGGGFDGVESAYPFMNPAQLRAKKPKNYGGAADYAHFVLQHGGSNLRKDELSADVPNVNDELVIANVENETVTVVVNTNNNNNNNSKSNIHANETTIAKVNVTRTDAIISAEPRNKTLIGLERMDPHALFNDPIYILIASLACLLVFGIVAVADLLYFKCLIWRNCWFHVNSEQKECPENSNTPTQETSDVNSSNQAMQAASDRDSATIRFENEAKSSSSNNRNDQCDDIMLKDLSHQGIRETNTRSSHSRDSNSHFSGNDENNIPIDSVQSISDTHHYTGPNGSVTKMTLKNNHLIVETEERNDISRDARETKMHYNTSEKDGVFVVEVSRGIDSENRANGNTTEADDDQIQPIPIEQSEKSPKQVVKAIKQIDECPEFEKHEEVQIHQPPAELTTSVGERNGLHQIEEVEEPANQSQSQSQLPNDNYENEAKAEEAQATLISNSNTGLSQSDLSSTSSTDSNKGYNYGNQELYSADEAPGSASRSPAIKVITPKTMINNGEENDEHDHSENGHNKESPTIIQQTTTHAMELNENGLEAAVIEPVELKADASDPQEDKVEETLEQLSNGNEIILPLADVIPTMASLEEKNEVMAESFDGTESESTVIEQTIPNGIANGHNHCNGHNGNETTSIEDHDLENGYDSILSLPDPPSNDEILGISDDCQIEANQLDSLPPPPPPSMFNMPEDNMNNMPDIVAEIKHKAIPMPISINGQKSNDDLCNGNSISNNNNTNGNCTSNHNNNNNNNNNNNGEQQDTMPSPPLSPQPLLAAAEEEINDNHGTVLATTAPLTPPESPPQSPPVHFNNSLVNLNGNINGNICVAPLPMAVDVNGS